MARNAKKTPKIFLYVSDLPEIPKVYTEFRAHLAHMISAAMRQVTTRLQ